MILNKFHKDQFPLLKRLKGEFKKNHGYVGTVFDTQKNKRPFPGQLYRSPRRISTGIQFVKVGDMFFITNMNRAMKNWHSTKHKALTGRRQQKDIVKHSSEASDFYRDTIKRAVQKLNSGTTSEIKLPLPLKLLRLL